MIIGGLVITVGLLRLSIKNDMVYSSYMGGEPSVSPLSSGMLSILKSLLIGGDTIDVIDEREITSPLESRLTFSYNTDTAERKTPNDEKFINPLYDLDALIDWLEKNPNELERLTKLINNQ